MAALVQQGLTPDDHLLDIGCGALRLGHLAVPFLRPGHYWGTDASRELMLHARTAELADPDRLPPDHLVGDADFTFPGVPGSITLAIAFAVFTHLPPPIPAQALHSLRARFPRLRAVLFTVFHAALGAAAFGSAALVATGAGLLGAGLATALAAEFATAFSAAS